MSAHPDPIARNKPVVNTGILLSGQAASYDVRQHQRRTQTTPASLRHCRRLLDALIVPYQSDNAFLSTIIANGNLISNSGLPASIALLQGPVQVPMASSPLHIMQKAKWCHAHHACPADATCTKSASQRRMLVEHASRHHGRAYTRALMDRCR